ncbi:MAG TPA: hypothetical protein VK206_06365, partial [Anaerolineales bacterium]|nr:hypothetical protein [Anaerolineales bacterium]
KMRGRTTISTPSKEPVGTDEQGLTTRCTRHRKEFREITDKELKRTSIYAISIEEWSGKENWEDRADQSNESSPLDEEGFE